MKYDGHMCTDSQQLVMSCIRMSLSLDCACGWEGASTHSQCYMVVRLDRFVQRCQAVSGSEVQMGSSAPQHLNQIGTSVQLGHESERRFWKHHTCRDD